MPSMAQDLPVGDDIRLLGRLLGDVVREQAGDEVFELIEGVRQARRRRPARRSQRRSPSSAARCSTPSIDDQLHVIRAFAWISLLANTAEDVHHERRRRFHRAAGSRPPGGQPRRGLRSPRADGVSADRRRPRCSRELGVSPVLTAHPTEVRRKTVLDALGRVADLLDERGRLADGDPERDELDDALRLEVLTLWQTAILRLSKLRVRDEINEALRYYDTSLFEVVPALQRDVERARRAAAGATTVDARAGGPHGLVDRRRPRRQPVRHRRRDALGHRRARRAAGARPPPRTRCNALSVELSMSSRLVTPTAALLDAGRALRRRLAVPRRRAVPPGAARHARPALRLRRDACSDDGAAGQPPHAVARPPYGSIDELVDDLDVVAASLRGHGAGGAGRRTRRAGAPRRGHVRRPPVRARHAPELGRARGGDRRAARRRRRRAPTTPPSTRRRGSTCWSPSCSSPRPLRSPWATYSDATRGELAVLDAAAGRRRAATGRRSCRTT